MSELLQRLEHLTNYSSQLIFVSGDSLAEQQRTLEQFLVTQSENTEVSFLAATPENDVISLRREICQQLLDQKVGSYIRPLRQLLLPLTKSSTPVLICIKQAQFIPEPFLEELWDMVVNSRNSTNHQHLNVILFAETKWAERAKKSLPATNANRPLLFNSHSILGSSEPGLNKSPISEAHRKRMSARLMAGAQDSIIRQKWFMASVSMVFILIFTGLLAWQYQDELAAVLAEPTPAVDTSTVAELDASPTPEAEADTTDSDDTIIAQLSEELSELEQQQQDKNTAPEEIIAESWQDALSKSIPKPENSSKVSDFASAEPINPSLNDNDAMPDESLDDSPVSASNSPAGDFPVDDIRSVEELERELGIESQNTTPKQMSDTTAPNYAFNEAQILALDDQQLLLQLAGMQNEAVLQRFLEDNTLKDNTWVYETQRYGGPWYVVLLAQPFANAAQARAQVNLLPRTIRDSQPFSKSVAQIRNEIETRK